MTSPSNSPVSPCTQQALPPPGGPPPAFHLSSGALHKALAGYCWWIPYRWMAGPGKHEGEGWEGEKCEKRKKGKRMRTISDISKPESERKEGENSQEGERKDGGSFRGRLSSPFFPSCFWRASWCFFFTFTSLSLSLFFLTQAVKTGSPELNHLVCSYPRFPPIYALSDHLCPWLHARSPWQPCPIRMWEEIFCPFLLSLYLLLTLCFLIMSLCASVCVSMCVFF